MDKLNEIINIVRFLTREGVCNDMQNEILSYHKLVANVITEINDVGKYERKLKKYNDVIFDTKRMRNECCINCSKHHTKVCFSEERKSCHSCDQFLCCHINNKGIPQFMIEVFKDDWLCLSCAKKKMCLLRTNHKK